MTRILFVHNRLTRFVLIDRDLLRERYEVREWSQRSRIVNVPALVQAVRASDVVVGWFASWHTLLPVWIARAFAKPCVLIVGGYDTARLPEIGYGSQRGGPKTWVAQAAIRGATCVATHSRFAREEVIRNARSDPGRVAVLYLGVEGREAPRLENKERLVVTVGNVNRVNLQRKGLETFVLAAARCPDVPFVVIGEWQDDAIARLRSVAPPNVQFTGYVDDAVLEGYLARARVYVQASRHEAFGLAVAEAMVAGCVPVVTRSGALPEVAGAAGLYVDAPDPEAVAAAVRLALDAGPEWGARARSHVLREFPLERRRQGLWAIVEQVRGGASNAGGIG